MRRISKEINFYLLALLKINITYSKESKVVLRNRMNLYSYRFRISTPVLSGMTKIWLKMTKFILTFKKW